MVLDQTRYKAFWSNPERYRLQYELNLVPKDTAYGLQRGTALHILEEEQHKGTAQADIEQRLNDEVPDSKARTVAKQMHRAYRATINPAVRKVAAEFEYRHRIPGSEHEIAGRIDEILEYNGKQWCGELKTANAKKRLEQVKHDWLYDAQADFEIIGARMSGHKVEGVLVRVIVEGTPPKIWPVEVTRDEPSLAVFLSTVHQTCETITMYRRTFGIDKPWPHIPNGYPCNTIGRCEHAAICQRVTIPPAALQNYKLRREHLTCMR